MDKGARMRGSLAAVLVLAAGWAGADEVHLVNGKSFEDVSARVVGDEVRIELPAGGEIRLPRSHVARIEEGESGMEVFRRRARELGPEAGAAEWLELAEWARARELSRGYREAALEAARREPGLPGVKAAMSELDFVWEERLSEWLPRAEAMRRRGLVPWNGEWVTAEERDRQIQAAWQREREAAEEARERARDERLDRLTRLVEVQTELEIARGLADTRAPRREVEPVYPVYYLPGFWFPPQPPHHGPPHHGPPQEPGPTPPQVPPRSNSGGFADYFSPIDPVDYAPGRLGGGGPAPGSLGGR